MRSIINATLFSGLLLLAGILPAAAETQPATAPQASAPSTSQLYSAGGEKTCLTCHNSHPVDFILQTPHAVKGNSRTPFGQNGCESCHGPAADHAAMKTGADGKLILPPVLFKKPKVEGVDVSPVAARNESCLSCHQADKTNARMNWQGSQHQANDIACVDCHTVHVSKDPVLVKQTQPDKCFTCHDQQRAETFELSHHPIREGKVVCADCHNPHGSPGPKLLKEFTVNDTCYTCHADKRGPMLWEHEPVREDCTNCHTPHGSTQATLLKDRPPYLCESCHANGGHNGAPFAGQNLPGANNTTNNGVFVASQFQMMNRGCLNCHSQVHGSNNPAGTFLTR